MVFSFVADCPRIGRRPCGRPPRVAVAELPLTGTWQKSKGFGDAARLG
jgi:hypothetical protein